jgi:hypothetical protein
VTVRLLGAADLEALVAHLIRHAGESGHGGAPVFGPHPRGRDRLGFVEVGRVADRFRVDDLEICDLSMTLDVRVIPS